MVESHDVSVGVPFCEFVVVVFVVVMASVVVVCISDNCTMVVANCSAVFVSVCESVFVDVVEPVAPSDVGAGVMGDLVVFRDLSFFAMMNLKRNSSYGFRDSAGAVL